MNLNIKFSLFFSCVVFTARQENDDIITNSLGYSLLVQNSNSMNSGITSVLTFGQSVNLTIAGHQLGPSESASGVACGHDVQPSYVTVAYDYLSNWSTVEIARPVRNSQCSYNEIVIADFRAFLN